MQIKVQTPAVSKLITLAPQHFAMVVGGQAKPTATKKSGGSQDKKGGGGKKK